MFEVRQKVICVREAPHQIWPECVYPRFHEVYTIRALRVNPRTQVLNGLLVEIVNPERDAPPDGFGEPFFGMWRFRPLVERRTDISVFRKMLVPSRAKESV
jgi:hypothetical protein